MAAIQSILYKFIGVILFQGLFDAFGAASLELAASRLGTRLQRLTFSVLVEQDVSFFDKSKTGKLMTILESNVGDVQNILTWDLGDTFEGVITSLVLLAYMWVTTWRMAMVFTLASILPLVIICFNAFFVEVTPFIYIHTYIYIYIYIYISIYMLPNITLQIALYKALTPPASGGRLCKKSSKS